MQEDISANVEEIVSKQFSIEQRIIFTHKYIVFFIKRIEEDYILRQKFMSIYQQLIEYNLLPILQNYEENPDVLILRIVKVPHKEEKSRLNYVLLLVTIVTILSAGYRFVFNDIFLAFFPEVNPIMTVIWYTIALFGIVAIHETGHIIATRRYKIKASLPYFIPDPFAVIPALPTIGGTFGAIISQKTPAPNRDALFDLGFSGPLIGFIAAVIVTIIGLKMSVVVPATTPGEILPSPLIFDILVRVIINPPENMDVLVHPLAFAGWVGFLITGLNLIPAGQLDGGHITRAIFGSEKHRVITYISIIVLIALMYIPMAILVLLLSYGREHPGPLEDITSISLKRKIGGIVSIIMIILSLPPLVVYMF
ncbi:MAG: site-2 protease family protein [Candidatus Asgardarchaeia archaeon]